MSTNVSEREARQVAEESRESEWERPSFGRELYAGRLRIDLLDPHPQPSAEDKQRGEAFLRKFETYLKTVDAEQIERDDKIPAKVVKSLADLGAFGMNIAPEYGGLGLSHLYYERALMLANSTHSALGALLSAHQSIGVPKPLKYFGSEEQKKKWLPRVAKGAISAFLLTEPDVGSDPARLQTLAEPTEDGSAYVINGTKLWITNGSVAEVMLIMARVPKSPGHKGGITAFVLERDMPGVEVVRRNQFLGIRGIENALMRFTNVQVPKENMVGEEGRGLKIALVTLNTGRLSLPATCLVAAKYSLKISREWAKERVQWGRPVGKHDAIAQKIANMAGITFAMEAMVELASLLADEERNDIRIEAAVAKLWCSEMAWKVADDMLQIRGGRGYETAESLRARGERPIPAEQVLRDLRITRIFEGSTEIMHLFIAREALDMHVDQAGALADPDASRGDKAKSAAKAGLFYARWFPTLTVGKGRVPVTYGDFGRLAPHVRYVERSARKLARSIFYGLGRYGPGMEFKQKLMARLVDIGAELFAMSAACVRAKMLATDEAYELADLFCRGSRRRVEQLYHELWHNDDTYNYKAAQKVLDGRYEFVEEGILDPSGSGPMISAGPAEAPAAKAV